MSRDLRTSIRQVKEEKRPFLDDSMRGPDVETRPRRPRRQVSRAGPYGTEVVRRGGCRARPFEDL